MVDDEGGSGGAGLCLDTDIIGDDYGMPDGCFAGGGNAFIVGAGNTRAVGGGGRSRGSSAVMVDFSYGVSGRQSIQIARLLYT